jgi:hypothetical protein
MRFGSRCKQRRLGTSLVLVTIKKRARPFAVAVDLKELALLSEDVRSKALIHPSREVFLPNECVERVLWELTIADRAILGFDILTIERSKPCIWGTSAYATEDQLPTKPWHDFIVRSLQLAIRDLGRITALSGLKPPFNDVWYAICRRRCKLPRLGRCRSPYPVPPIGGLVRLTSLDRLLHHA